MVPIGIVGALVVASATTGAAMALAAGGDPASSTVSRDDPIAAHDHPTPTAPAPTAPASPESAPAESGGLHGPAPAGGAQHAQAALAPYVERRADAARAEQEAADALVVGVRATLEGLATVDAAIAAGYRPPATPRGPMWHYRNPTLMRDGDVLDSERPEGLVYYTRDGVTPVLLGAFFVARPGVPAPAPAGDLVVWHSHHPSCAGFFATADEPCAATRRMLHVWSVEEADLARRTGELVDVRVVDPFGAPFGASVERTR